MNATIEKSKADAYTEGAKMLQFLRALGNEDQRIAYAVLEGMRLQKRIDETTGQNSQRKTVSA